MPRAGRGPWPAAAEARHAPRGCSSACGTRGSSSACACSAGRSSSRGLVFVAGQALVRDPRWGPTTAAHGTRVTLATERGRRAPLHHSPHAPPSAAATATPRLHRCGNICGETFFPCSTRLFPAFGPRLRSFPGVILPHPRHFPVHSPAAPFPPIATVGTIAPSRRNASDHNPHRACQHPYRLGASGCPCCAFRPLRHRR